MLISGEVHGDEIIGPQVAIEFLDLLVNEYGQDPNVTRLVDSRFITVLPMANAAGYEQNMRGALVMTALSTFEVLQLPGVRNSTGH